MGKLDIVILIIISLVGLKCYFMGLTRNILGLAAIVIGIFIANRTWTYLADLLNNLIKNEQVIKIVSIIIIFVGVTVLVAYFFTKLNLIVQKSVISWINNILGFAFGIALASLLIGSALLLLEKYAAGSIQNSIVQSKFAPYLMEFTKYVISVSKVVIDKSEKISVYNIP